MLLKIENLTVRYGERVAVHDLSLSIDTGQVVALLGINGAGKSSLLRAIVGLTPCTAETMSFDGKDLSRLPTHKRIAHGLRYLPEGRGVFPSLTVDQNIVSGGSGRKVDAAARELAYELFPELVKRRSSLAGSLSGGEQQMVSLARCLSGEPRLLLLDELSLGLAPVVVQRLFAKLDDLRAANTSILIVEQFAHMALKTADMAGVIVQGKLTRFTSAAELAALSADDLAALYFGDHAGDLIEQV